MVFLQEFFLKKLIKIKKNPQTTKMHAKLPSMQRVKYCNGGYNVREATA